MMEVKYSQFNDDRHVNDSDDDDDEDINIHMRKVGLRRTKRENSETRKKSV